MELAAPSPIAARALQAVVAVEKALARDAVSGMRETREAERRGSLCETVGGDPGALGSAFRELNAERRARGANDETCLWSAVLPGSMELS